jgi:Na+/H+ antiporter NhaD/arsenite permease-like protein
LSLSEALKAIDLDAIALLLGMMIIVSQLRVSGFFELAARFALRHAQSAPVLLTAIVIVTGFFSAFLVNDSSPYDVKPRQERYEQPTGSR